MKNAPAKEFRPTLRELYTWHLGPRNEGLFYHPNFDREHWWNSADVVDPLAALYELARRHPDVLVAHIVPELLCLGPGFHLLYWLRDFGLKPWPKLRELDQRAWKYFASTMKGLDFRDDRVRCFSLEDEAVGVIQSKRAFTEKRYQKMTISKVSRLIEKDMRKNPPLRKEIEAGIKREALSAYRQDYLLIAVALDMAEADAKRLMVQTWSQHRKEKKIFKHRARSEQWLPIIARFEDEETSGKAYAPSFTAFRRALDGLPFPSPRFML